MLALSFIVADVRTRLTRARASIPFTERHSASRHLGKRRNSGSELRVCTAVTPYPRKQFDIRSPSRHDIACERDPITVLVGRFVLAAISHSRVTFGQMQCSVVSRVEPKSSGPCRTSRGLLRQLNAAAKYVPVRLPGAPLTSERTPKRAAPSVAKDFIGGGRRRAVCSRRF
jgi:hypothetical protein